MKLTINPVLLARLCLIVTLGLMSAFLTVENAKAESMCGVDGQNNYILGFPTFQPYINKNLNMLPAAGSDKFLIQENAYTTMPPGGGDFRIECKVSHMSNDDPIVYPNQNGKAHHHTFFGNTSLAYNSDLMNLANVGNSTCRGGIVNRSAYWVPSMVDTATGQPLMPDGGLWYYKSGLIGYFDPTTAGVRMPPNGLRMIAGNAKAKNDVEASKHTAFSCRAPDGKFVVPNQRTIPACPEGHTIIASVTFPQCWDGLNLDWLDHISHMTYDYKYSFHTVDGKLRKKYTCPASHPVPIVSLGLSIYYKVKTADGTANWRLASDNYQKEGQNAGYSMHGDFVSGWNEEYAKKIEKNCLQQKVDCGSDKVGDGIRLMGR